VGEAVVETEGGADIAARQKKNREEPSKRGCEPAWAAKQAARRDFNSLQRIQPELNR
jgi:hypothetical protein